MGNCKDRVLSWSAYNLVHRLEEEEEEEEEVVGMMMLPPQVESEVYLHPSSLQQLKQKPKKSLRI
jgi:hypothetical protein